MVTVGGGRGQTTTTVTKKLNSKRH